MVKIEEKIGNSLKKLLDYIQTENLKGYDPYDALNSLLLDRLSFNSRTMKLIYTQILKRCPINLRPVLGIQKDYNPKGLGLFLMGYVKLYQLEKNTNYLVMIEKIVTRIKNVQSKGFSGMCWGYHFDWQSEKFLTRKFTPTIVNTAYIANALLDAYEVTHDANLLDMAKSSCDFILNDLYVFNTGNSICFSYNPISKMKIHNANVLGAGLLARVYSIFKEEKLFEYAKKAIKYTIGHQHNDGSWYYGESHQEDGCWQKGTNNQKEQDDSDPGYVSYIDSYHTGFILESINQYTKFTQDEEYVKNLKSGLDFYQKNFFLTDGTPKYFHDKTYPIDIHSAAQAILTFVKLGDLLHNETMRKKVTHWMIDTMQSPKGYFYFRKGKMVKNKIPYIRWSQAWSFYALATYWLYLKNTSKD